MVVGIIFWGCVLFRLDYVLVFVEFFIIIVVLWVVKKKCFFGLFVFLRDFEGGLIVGGVFVVMEVVIVVRIGFVVVVLILCFCVLGFCVFCNVC